MRLALILLVILILGALAYGAWNEFHAVRAELVSQREAIGSEWAQVDLAMQRRADLILTLEPPTRRATYREAGLWLELREACAKLAAAVTPAARIQANMRVSELLSQVTKLESSATLQRLADAENRIDVERRRYNEMLEHYNAEIQRFPENIVASLAGFHRDDAYLPTATGH